MAGNTNLLAAAAVAAGVAAPVVAVAASIVPKINTSDAPANADAAKAALALAEGGSLTAAKAIYKRAQYIQVATSAQPWKDALNKLRADHPEFSPFYGDNKPPAPVPEEWVLNVAPGDVNALILQHPSQYTGGAQGPTGSPNAPTATGTNTLSAGVLGELPGGFTWKQAGLLALVGVGVYFLVKKFGH